MCASVKSQNKTNSIVEEGIGIFGAPIFEDCDEKSSINNANLSKFDGNSSIQADDTYFRRPYRRVPQAEPLREKIIPLKKDD